MQHFPLRDPLCMFVEQVLTLIDKGRKGTCRKHLHPEQFISGKEDVANNCVHGNHTTVRNLSTVSGGSPTISRGAGTVPSTDMAPLGCLACALPACAWVAHTTHCLWINSREFNHTLCFACASTALAALGQFVELTTRFPQA